MLKEKTAVLVCVIASLFALSSCGPVSENTELQAVQNAGSVSETVTETEVTSETASETTEETEITTAAETSATEITSADETTEVSETKAETKADTASDKPYVSAYTELAKKLTEENGDKVTFALIDVDGDDIPELSAGQLGYWVSLYTFADGEVHTVMDQYPYGVSGNVGYDYISGQNYLHYSSAESAGIIRYDTYMKINDKHELEEIACIEARFFEDKNGNGRADEDEIASYTENAKYYKDGKEITDEEVSSYAKAEFKEVAGSLTFDELVDKMK